MCPSHLVTMMDQALLWSVARTRTCCSTMDPRMQVYASERLVLLEVEQEEQNVEQLAPPVQEEDDLVEEYVHLCDA